MVGDVDEVELGVLEPGELLEGGQVAVAAVVIHQLRVFVTITRAHAAPANRGHQ